MSVPECTCEGNGDKTFFCPVFRMNMTPKFHESCQTKESVRKAFQIRKHQIEMAEKEPETEGPGLMKMAKGFVKSAVEHVRDGMAHVTPEEQQKRLDICNQCDKKQGNRCGECGCFLKIKTSWASSECPLKKW